MGVGSLRSPEAVAPYAAQVKGEVTAMRHNPDGTTFLPVQDFGLVIALSGKQKITPDRKYLLQVFLDHASLAIRNNEMLATGEVSFNTAARSNVTALFADIVGFTALAEEMAPEDVLRLLREFHGLCRSLDVPLLITQEVVDAVRADTTGERDLEALLADFLDRGDIPVRNRKEPLHVWSLPRGDRVGSLRETLV